MHELFWEAQKLIAFRDDDGVYVCSKARRRYTKSGVKEWRWEIGTYGPRGGFKPIERGRWTISFADVREDRERRLRDICKERVPEFAVDVSDA
jgi:hypothetical protein